MTETHCDLDQLNLTTQTYNALRRGGVHTCAQLLHMGRAEVRKLRLIGPVAEQEIASQLEAVHGIEWTEQGAPLPELPAYSVAARMVQVLGLGDTGDIRLGLARVLRESASEKPKILRIIAFQLEHGA